MENKDALQKIVDNMVRAAANDVRAGKDFDIGHATGLFLAARQIATEMGLVFPSEESDFGSFCERIKAARK